MMWSLGGWLLTPFLQKIGPEATQKLRERVAAEVKTTFASSYAKEISLAEALQLDSIAVYGQQATGKKYLVNPSKGLKQTGQSLRRTHGLPKRRWGHAGTGLERSGKVGGIGESANETDRVDRVVATEQQFGGMLDPGFASQNLQ